MVKYILYDYHLSFYYKRARINVVYEKCGISRKRIALNLLNNRTWNRSATAYVSASRLGAAIIHLYSYWILVRLSIAVDNRIYYSISKQP